MTFWTAYYSSDVSQNVRIYFLQLADEPICHHHRDQLQQHTLTRMASCERPTFIVKQRPTLIFYSAPWNSGATLIRIVCFALQSTTVCSVTRDKWPLYQREGIHVPGLTRKHTLLACDHGLTRMSSSVKAPASLAGKWKSCDDRQNCQHAGCGERIRLPGLN